MKTTNRGLMHTNDQEGQYVREPEDNVTVYQLGHFEVMQFGLALQYLSDIMGDDLKIVMQNGMTEDQYTRLYGNLDLTWIRAIRHVFMQDGNITIIRTNQPE